MIDEIKQLESVARLLEPDLGQREHLLQQVSAYSQEYLEGISDAPANYTSEDGRGLIDSPIAEEGICNLEVPGLRALDGTDHQAACHLRTGAHQHLDKTGSS